MAYSKVLAERVRKYLSGLGEFQIEEKTMMGGLAFMVNGKMCINISDENLMCRVDPALKEELSRRTGYQPMVMKGRVLDGYCYIEPEGTETERALSYWIELCLNYNQHAKASVKKRKAEKV